MNNFNVGDLVIIKDWDEMVEQYGNQDDHDNWINTYHTFTRDMSHLCGELATITSMRGRDVDLEFSNPDVYDTDWAFSIDMIKLVVRDSPKKEIVTGFPMDKALDDAMELLTKYRYLGHNKDAIRTIFETCLTNKDDLRQVMRKNPHWDEEQQAIIWKENYETGIDVQHVVESIEWFIEKLYEHFGNEYKMEFDPNRFEQVKRYVSFSSEYMCANRYCIEEVRKALEHQYVAYREEYDKLTNIYNNSEFIGTTNTYIPVVKYREMCAVAQFLKAVRNANISKIDEDLCKYAKKIDEFWATKCKIGQKVSRFVQKVLTHYALDKIVIMKKITRNGEMQEKNFGYEYYRAMFGDAINPISISKYTIISINPFDYWTMSFGSNWSSCQTIDKINFRRIGSNHYQGQSSSGTESYMLDKSTIVFYTVDENYKGEMWKADKEKRMLFHMSGDCKAFIFGRLYPDGRDGGETGLAAQFRAVVQKTFSECVGFNNLWKTEKGTCERYAISVGTHYRDYNSYGVCGYSYTEGRMPKIRIGHNPICPNCGRQHTFNESIFCTDHHRMDYVKCSYCGDRIRNMADAVICVENGNVYCCEGCAKRHNVRYCNNDRAYHSEGNWYLDPYDGYAYAFTEDTIKTVDGACFVNEDHARAYHYKLTDEGKWVLM